MRKNLVLTFSFISLGLIQALIACSPVKFSTAPSDCQKAGICTVAQGKTTYNYTVTTSTTPLDVLLVIDNSGSMTPNQQGMANRFDSFLDLIKDFDYHIGVVTTDVIDPQFPKLQGAQLIPFKDGSEFLTSSSADASRLLEQNIVRPETNTCDQYLRSHNDCANSNSCQDYALYCPSPDSRAIYAANLVTQRTDADGSRGNFLRPDAPLDVIILSNSDERVCGGQSTCPYQLDSMDDPSMLAQTLQTRFGGAKPLTIHSIIIRPGDTNCKNQQYWSSTLFGQYAPFYKEAAQETGGVVGSICASSYSTQLQQIGQISRNQLLNQVSLKCKSTDANLSFTLSPQPSSPITGQLDSSGEVLKFSSPLPEGTTLNLTYTCQ